VNGSPETQTTVAELSTDPVIHPAPLDALQLDRMPTEAHFRRDHFSAPPSRPEPWRLEIAADAGRTFELDMDALRSYPRRELRVVLECAGHRRAEHRAPTRGAPWSIGAVSEASWAGTSLRNVIEDSRHGSTRFVLLEGADSGPFRDAGTFHFARALPLERALHPDTLLAWEMNGEPLPAGHGAPVRAIVPGWYATDSVKWLKRISLLDEPFTGPFEVIDYRLSTDPTVQGARMTALPVHALLTSHRPDERVSTGRCVLEGIAWGGEGGVARVDVSVNGQDWQEATLEPPSSRYSFARWRLSWQADAGWSTVAVRATDAAGREQPPQPSWNPGGYANASIQRVDLLAE
jgi:DMSO/TMAO reductase YedYZ molybdopterin-dependent catalytic subunit